MTRLATLALVLSACAGCGDDGGGKIAVDIDNGSCGADVRFTGEVVDWDSNDQAGGDFCGVFNSMLSGTSGGETTTAPNGRFDTCVPSGSATTAAGVTPPTGPTPCSMGNVYSTHATMIADPSTISAGADFSLRLFTDARRDALYAQTGGPFDPAKGHVLVHVFGDATRDVTLSSAHDATLSYTKGASATWVQGTHGDYVFFPNVTLDGSTMVTVAGQSVGAGPVTPVAGQITALTVYTR
jgi:hypothetical protein